MAALPAYATQAAAMIERVAQGSVGEAEFGAWLEANAHAQGG